jgi:hypothetical protein
MFGCIALPRGGDLNHGAISVPIARDARDNFIPGNRSSPFHIA